MSDPLWSFEHFEVFFSGSLCLAILAHAVQTFPTPDNKYWQWILGVIQFAVGQRYRAVNTLAGEGTLTTQVSKDTVNPPAKIDALPVPPKD